MANEAVVTSGLQIVKGNLNYQSRPGSFRATVTGTAGPTPGVLLVATTGTTVSLAQLGTPGLCRVQNLDDTNFVMLGIHDGTSFFPMIELLPGESFVFRLWRHLGDEFVGTGTPSDVNTLRLMADTAECRVLVEAFEV